MPPIAAAIALLLAAGFTNRVSADPLTVAPASTSWERFNPTLELPRIYNSDGSLPSGAEMPDATTLPEAAPESAAPDAALPAPDAIEPAASEAAPSGPTVTHGDPPLADGHHNSAASNGAAGNGNQSADDDASLPEPDPETVLSSPSTLDPTDGTDYGAAQSGTAAVDPNSNPVGDARDYQNEQIDAPSVVLIPPPYYGPRQPTYGYPYYGPVMGAYSSFSRTPAMSMPPPIPDTARFGAMPPPGYPWIGGSAMVPWSAMHPNLPATTLHIPPSRMMLPSFPMH